MARKIEPAKSLSLGLLCPLLGLIYLVAGILKVYDPGRFLYDLQTFDILPYQLNYVMALFLPWLEIIASLGFILRKAFKESGLILLALNFSFLIFVIWSYFAGIDTDCGCFGDWLIFPNFSIHIFFNLITLCGFIVCLRFIHPKSSENAMD